METWKKNIIKIDPSIAEVIKRNDNKELIYVEDVSYTNVPFKAWTTLDNKPIYILTDSFMLDVFEYDQTGKVIFHTIYQSVEREEYCKKITTAIYKYDDMENKIYEKHIYSTNNYEEMRSYFNKDNKCIKSDHYCSMDKERFITWYDQNGRRIKCAKYNYLSTNEKCPYSYFDNLYIENGKNYRKGVCSTTLNKNIYASKYLSIMNKEKSGYKLYRFFTYQVSKYFKPYEKIKYKLKVKEKRK